MKKRNAWWVAGVTCAISMPVVAGDVSVGSEALEEVIITGSRLGGPAAASPVTVFDAARIEEMGASTIADVLKYLPQQPYSRGEESRFGGAQFAELRGLGADTTLVLINGRRASVTAANAASNAFDLNTIPVSAIERIEVLPDAASAVYGADAVGGVVNILLKRDLEGIEADLRYGAASGGGEERRASVAGGFVAERVQATLVLDYFERDPLFGEERERWHDQDYRRFGSSDQRTTESNPGNVSSLTEDNLPGLASPIAAVPAGSTGVGLAPADFVATAGQQNLDSAARFDSILPASRRTSAFATLDAQVTDTVDVFVEAMYADRRQTAQYSPPSGSGVATADNPFNPFGVDVGVNFLLTALGAEEEVVDSQSLRLVGGLRGAIGQWDWELSYLEGHEAADAWSTNLADPGAVEAALASSDPAQALNPFQDGPGGSAALLASLRAPRDTSHYESDADQWTAFVRGSLWTFPAGPMQVVVGGEFRDESILFDSSFFVGEGREVSAGFVELKVPLVDATMGWHGINLLTVNLAARYDDYSDFGDTFNPQATLTWLPVSDVAVRATYGTSFRPPSLFELYSPRRTLPGNAVADPRRGGQTAIVTVYSGGNPQLDPITATSWSAGVHWTPAGSGLDLGATYWNIALDDRVRIFSRQLVLANEALFPERVVRAAPTAADVAVGWPGRLLSIDSSRINFGTLETDGVDLTAQWHTETSIGTFAPSLGATWVNEYLAGSAPGTPAVDRIDLASNDGTITAWRVQAGLLWQCGIWGASLDARYLPSYDDADFTGTRTGRRVDAQMLVDAQVNIDLRRGESTAWWSGLALQVGASNLFDDAPPFAEIGSPFGYDLTQGDLRQRFWYVNLAKRL